jgi:hypothetical protein
MPVPCMMLYALAILFIFTLLIGVHAETEFVLYINCSSYLLVIYWIGAYVRAVFVLDDFFPTRIACWPYVYTIL